MTDRTPDITLHYAPRTRAFSALWMLEELGVPYRLESFELRGGRLRTPEFKALNPLGKVPLVIDHGRPVSETGAIAVLLGDRYGSPELVPGIDDPDRAAYLRWLFFAGNVLEPSYCQKVFGWQADPSTLGWGSYERMVEMLEGGIEPGPWLLGDRFTLADLVIGNYLLFGAQFGMIEAGSKLAAFGQRVADRPSYGRASAIEAREGERFPMKQP